MGVKITNPKAKKKVQPIPQAEVPNFILESMAAIFGAAISASLAPVLQKLYTEKKKVFTKTRLQAVLAIFGAIAEETAKTNTKLDDTAVNVFISSIQTLIDNNKK